MLVNFPAHLALYDTDHGGAQQEVKIEVVLSHALQFQGLHYQDQKIKISAIAQSFKIHSNPSDFPAHCSSR